MPICKRLKTFLDENRVRYTVLVHSPAFTSQETAAAAHVHGQKFVKSTMVKVDGQHTMVVTTANHKIDLPMLKKALAASDAGIEREQDFEGIFEDCDLGGMPPFGNLYGIPVVVDERAFEDEEIAFNGGDHTTLVTMAFADFERLVRPKKAAVSVRLD